MSLDATISPVERIPFTDALPLLQIMQVIAPFVFLGSILVIWAVTSLTLVYGGGQDRPPLGVILMRLIKPGWTPRRRKATALRPAQKTKEYVVEPVSFGRKKTAASYNAGLATAPVRN
ncbi:hypothetical protein P7B02_16820 [Caulobacter segnis]|uniref:hypothetical protein n=1 Tax=Caulobacter segnis TaxID=88688 RepID=UPI00240F6A42|nr:hypothetical protein [Caulobacter segnis]MDG2523196.1 hypothetical protein [Caulobacter segnis]